jgi:Eukaryotic translation initiation factor eIF2A
VPARVVLLEIPSRNELRVKNLFNVADCKMHWQKSGDYLCVKVSVKDNLSLKKVKRLPVPRTGFYSTKDYGPALYKKKLVASAAPEFLFFRLIDTRRFLKRTRM